MASQQHSVITALCLTGLGALGTALGGLLVVIHPKMSFARLGLLQGFAGGLMLCISMVDLLPAALSELGFMAANLWFFAGVLFFAAVVAVLPEPQLTVPPAPAKAAKAKGNGPSSAPLNSSNSKPDADDVRKRREVLLSGLITALGIALHNFPEGVAVYLASLKSHAVGASLAAAIALHNIPEGVAVALPVYFATGSRMQGLKYAVVSGLAEPLGVLVLACFTVNMSTGMVESMLAAVGGIMAFLALHELLPLAIEHAGRSAAVRSLFVGMTLMSGNLYLLDHWIGEGHH